jgi:hypothetical protein
MTDLVSIYDRRVREFVDDMGENFAGSLRAHMAGLHRVAKELQATRGLSRLPSVGETEEALADARAG